MAREGSMPDRVNVRHAGGLPMPLQAALPTLVRHYSQESALVLTEQAAKPRLRLYLNKEQFMARIRGASA